MAPPAGGAAPAAEPSSPAVLLAVHAAVRPLGAGHDAEAQLRRLQLSADPERPGRFRLGLLGTGPGAVSVGRGQRSQPSLHSPADCPHAVTFSSLACKNGVNALKLSRGIGKITGKKGLGR